MNLIANLLQSWITMQPSLALCTQALVHKTIGWRVEPRNETTGVEAGVHISLVPSPSLSLAVQ